MLKFKVVLDDMHITHDSNYVSNVYLQVTNFAGGDLSTAFIVQ